MWQGISLPSDLELTDSDSLAAVRIGELESDREITIDGCLLGTIPYTRPLKLKPTDGVLLAQCWKLSIDGFPRKSIVLPPSLRLRSQPQTFKNGNPFIRVMRMRAESKMLSMLDHDTLNYTQANARVRGAPVETELRLCLFESPDTPVAPVMRWMEGCGLPFWPFKRLRFMMSAEQELFHD